MTAEQRQSLNTLRDQIVMMQNFCHRAEGYLTDAEQEPNNEIVDRLISDAQGLVDQCKE